MAIEKSTTVEQEKQLDTNQKVEAFFLNNRKVISGLLIGIAVAIGGYFGYQQLFLKPQEAEAQNKIGLAQANFAKDSLQIALDGDGINPGFLGIIESYGRTSTGNLAHYYAGIIYLKLKDFDQAIMHLEKHKPATDELAGMTYEQLGHAYSEKNEMTKAVDFYTKAGEAANSDFFSPYFYKMAGDLLAVQEDYKGANAIYQIIKKEFPLSAEGQNIDMEIAFTQTKMGN